MYHQGVFTNKGEGTTVRRLKKALIGRNRNMTSDRKKKKVLIYTDKTNKNLI